MAKFSAIPFVKKLVAFFKQGTSPKGLAMSTTIGVMLGIFPVLGVTTWLTTLIGVRFKLNVPLMLALLYLVWPFQIGLIIPFLRFGEWFYEVPKTPLSLAQIQLAFEADFFAAVVKYWEANLLAAGGWLIIVFPVGLSFYLVLVSLFKYTSRRQKIATVKANQS